MSKPLLTRRSAANRLASSASIAGLILGQTITPAMAQNYLDIFNRPSDGNHVGWSLEASSASGAYRHLFEAHAQIRMQAQNGNIRPLPSSGTFESRDGHHRFLPVEVHLDNRNGSIEGFVTQDDTRLYSEDRHGRYQIFSRICSDDALVDVGGLMLPNHMFQYTIVTYMRVLPTTLDKPEQLFGMAGYNQTIGPNEVVASIPAFFLPEPTPTALRDVLGNPIAVPDCITRTYPSDRNGPYAALVSRVTPSKIVADGGMWTEEDLRPGQCPPAEHPDRVIGIAEYRRDVYRSINRIIDTNGVNVLEAAGLGATPWTYYGGCRELETSIMNVDQTCTRMIAGQPSEAIRVYEAPVRELRPDKGYYELFEDRKWELLGTPDTWEIFLDLCAPNENAPEIIEVVTPLNERETNLTCPSTHPLGSWDRERDGTSTNFSVTNTNFEPWDLVLWDDWRTTRNDCHTISTSSSVESTTSGCSTSQRTVTTNTTTYHDGRPQVVTSSATPWVPVTSNCGGGGGSDNGSYDVDGDGRGDYRTWGEAVRAGYRDTAVSVPDYCGVCNGPRNTDGSRGNGGNNKVICTELMRQELISREDYVLCARHSYATLSEAHFRGYHIWAVPVVKWMRKSPRATRAWRVLAQARMNDIAYKTGHRAVPDHFGRTLNLLGEPLCWLIGQFVGATDYAAHLYANKEINHDLA